MNPIPTINKDEVLARLGGDEELLYEIVQMYFEDYPALVAQMEQAIADGSAATLTRAAHDLKGLLSNFSSPKVTAAAQAVEQVGKLNQLVDAPARLQTLCDELSNLSATLQHWLERR